MNELKNLSEFNKVLASYQPSQAAKQTLARTKLVLLLGVSASGRNTIINQLLKTGDYHFIVSDTTRQPRSNNGVMEQNGREYWFRTEGEILEDLRQGKFLEAEVIHGQQVSGISIRELEKASAANQIAINEVDIGGVEAVVNSKPDTLSILILPPSFEEWQHRITSRGEMPKEELKRRLETASRIFAAGIEGKFLVPVINANLDEAVADVHDLIINGKYDSDKMKLATELIEILYKQTQDYLKEL